MKNHIKRIAAPRRWHISRKAESFTTRPHPGAHPMTEGMPLGMILRDQLQLTSSMSETKKLLNNNDVLVDGKRRKDHRFITGLFDVVSYGDSQYRLTFDTKGRIIVVPIPLEEKGKKICQVIGKTIIKKGKTQVNLYDGKNILTDEKVSVGDTVLLELPSFKILKVFPLQKSAVVFIRAGKRSGDSGILKELQGNVAIYESNGQKIETLKEYLFVVGEKKPEVTIHAK